MIKNFNKYLNDGMSDIDRILDKMIRVGIEGLTSDEKKYLEDFKSGNNKPFKPTKEPIKHITKKTKDPIAELNKYLGKDYDFSKGFYFDVYYKPSESDIAQIEIVPIDFYEDEGVLIDTHISDVLEIYFPNCRSYINEMCESLFEFLPFKIDSKAKKMQAIEFMESKGFIRKNLAIS